MSLPSDVDPEAALEAASSIDENTPIGGFSLLESPAISTNGYEEPKSQTDSRKGLKLGLGLGLPLIFLALLVMAIFAYKKDKEINKEEDKDLYESGKSSTHGIRQENII